MQRYTFSSTLFNVAAHKNVTGTSMPAAAAISALDESRHKDAKRTAAAAAVTLSLSGRNDVVLYDE